MTLHASSKRIVSLFMLILFLVSLGVYALNSKWLAHEFDHGRQTFVADHDHAPQSGAEDNADPAPLSDFEHRMAHFSSFLQPLLITSMLDGIAESPSRASPMLMRSLALPSPQIEPPFRPPRATSRI